MTASIDTQFFFDLGQYNIKEVRHAPRSAPDFDDIAVRRRLRDQSYFFDRVVRQNETYFETLHIRKEIRKAVSDSAESLAKTLHGKLETIIPFQDVITALLPDSKLLSERVILDYDAPSEFYFCKKSAGFIVPLGFNSFCVITKNKKDSDEIMNYIKTESEKLNNVTKDFGLSIEEVASGKKYQENILKSSNNVQNIQQKEPKNDFEKEVINFCNELTNSILSNVDISFIEPTETYECDNFIGMNESTRRIIEPTDYTATTDPLPKGENFKSQIILRALDKARRLGASSIVIVKGYPEQAYSDVKKIAESRGIILLNETNYKSSLPQILCNDLIKAFGEPARSRFQGYIPIRG